MSDQLTTEDIKKAVRDTLDEHRKEFWVEPEEHYNQHKFIDGMMRSAGTVKKYGLITTATALTGYVLKSIFFKVP